MIEWLVKLNFSLNLKQSYFAGSNPALRKLYIWAEMAKSADAPR